MQGHRQELVRNLLRDSRAAARVARLHYVPPGESGIERRGRPRHFRYLDPSGRPVRDRRTLARIASLAIPPAWERVWISRSEKGHVQATGFDSRGRKQYRYHAAWRRIRDRAKYEDIVPFVRALPRLRTRIERDLRRRSFDKNSVIAMILGVMERTQIRIGNREYARANGSYGLTTLHNGHARVRRDQVELEFRGKGGKKWHTRIRDRRLASAIRRCRELPGRPLFQWVDAEGGAHAVTSTDVNEYIRETTGQPFTAKEFRTWAGTLLAARKLLEYRAEEGEQGAKQALIAATEEVASTLGNTVAVCRRCYIDPLLVDCHLRGELRKKLTRQVGLARRHPRRRLSVEEVAVERLLESLARRRAA